MISIRFVNENCGRAKQEAVPFDPLAAVLNLMNTPPLPEQIEFHRDYLWRRDEETPR